MTEQFNGLVKPAERLGVSDTRDMRSRLRLEQADLKEVRRDLLHRRWRVRQGDRTKEADAERGRLDLAIKALEDEIEQGAALLPPARRRGP